MEEIKQLHSLNLEWGCITNMMDKISDIEDKIDGGWPELVEMIADAVDEESNNKTPPAELFLYLYHFLFRLYYRLKINPTVREFNTVTRENILGKEVFRVTNYNYKHYKFAKKSGSEKITNDFIDFDADSLQPGVRKAFEKKCK